MNGPLETPSETISTTPSQVPFLSFCHNRLVQGRNFAANSRPIYRKANQQNRRKGKLRRKLRVRSRITRRRRDASHTRAHCRTGCQEKKGAEKRKAPLPMGSKFLCEVCPCSKVYPENTEPRRDGEADRSRRRGAAKRIGDGRDARAPGLPGALRGSAVKGKRFAARS